MPTLAYRRTRGDMIQVFKLLNNKYDADLPGLLTRCTNNLRGHDQKLFLHHANKDIRKYNFNLRVVKLWNSLPEYVINTEETHIFERNLDNFWASQELYYDNFKAEIDTKLKTNRV